MLTTMGSAILRVSSSVSGICTNWAWRRYSSREVWFRRGSAGSVALCRQHATPLLRPDLGEAGQVLQKPRTHEMRLAIVCAAGEAQFSSHFQEMLSEEMRGSSFAIIATREEALTRLGAR